MKNLFFILSFFLFFGCNGQQPTTLKVQPSKSTQGVNMQAKYVLTVWSSKKKRFATYQVATYHRSGDWVMFTIVGEKFQAMELHWSGVTSLRDNKGNLINF